jgi:hypothetical protein
MIGVKRYQRHWLIAILPVYVLGNVVSLWSVWFLTNVFLGWRGVIPGTVIAHFLGDITAEPSVSLFLWRCFNLAVPVPFIILLVAEVRMTVRGRLFARNSRVLYPASVLTALYVTTWLAVMYVWWRFVGYAF